MLGEEERLEDVFKGKPNTRGKKKSCIDIVLSQTTHTFFFFLFFCLTCFLVVQRIPKVIQKRFEIKVPSERFRHVETIKPFTFFFLFRLSSVYYLPHLGSDYDPPPSYSNQCPFTPFSFYYSFYLHLFRFILLCICPLSHFIL